MNNFKHFLWCIAFKLCSFLFLRPLYNPCYSIRNVKSIFDVFSISHPPLYIFVSIVCIYLRLKSVIISTDKFQSNIPFFFLPNWNLGTDWRDCLSHRVWSNNSRSQMTISTEHSPSVKIYVDLGGLLLVENKELEQSEIHDHSFVVVLDEVLHSSDPCWVMRIIITTPTTARSSFLYHSQFLLFWISLCCESEPGWDCWVN